MKVGTRSPPQAVRSTQRFHMLARTRTHTRTLTDESKQAETSDDDGETPRR